MNELAEIIKSTLTREGSILDADGEIVAVARDGSGLFPRASLKLYGYVWCVIWDDIQGYMVRLHASPVQMLVGKSIWNKKLGYYLVTKKNNKYYIVKGKESIRVSKGRMLEVANEWYS